MRVGDKAYIIESNRTIREVEIKRCSGGLFLVRFTDSGGGIQVRRNRLFATHEEAEQSLPKPSPQKSRSAIRMIIGIDIGRTNNYKGFIIISNVIKLTMIKRFELIILLTRHKAVQNQSVYPLQRWLLPDYG